MHSTQSSQNVHGECESTICKEMRVHKSDAAASAKGKKLLSEALEERIILLSSWE